MAREAAEQYGGAAPGAPLEAHLECAARDTAVPASTRLALLARGGGCMPATRFWGAAARGDWEPRLEARLRHVTRDHGPPARPNPPALQGGPTLKKFHP